MFKRLSTGVLATFLVLVAVACSDDDSGGTQNAGAESACFWQCDPNSSGCVSATGMTQADCDSMAADDCGAVTPMAVEFQASCSCPGFDEPGECTNPPPWYQ